MRGNRTELTEGQRNVGGERGFHRCTRTGYRLASDRLGCPRKCGLSSGGTLLRQGTVEVALSDGRSRFEPAEEFLDVGEFGNLAARHAACFGPWAAVMVERRYAYHSVAHAVLSH
jgi:hypothetical protein